MDTEKINEASSEKNLSVKSVEMGELVPNEVDGVIVALVDIENEDRKEFQIHVEKDFTGEKWKKWRNNRGGIFYKDLKNWYYNKEHGKYVLIGENGETTIARLIEDYEIEEFKTLKLIDGKIKDKPYMVYRFVREGEKLTKSDRYIEESAEDIAFEHNLIISNYIASDEANVNPGGINVSLFDD